MTWLVSPYYTLPAKPPATPWVIWNMAVNFLSDAENAELKFLSASPDPDYVNPGTYIKSKIAYAESLANGATATAAQFLEEAGFVYMPPGWDPTTAAIQMCIAFFVVLQGIPVNLGDAQTNDVYDAWVNHTGQYYGGHLPAAPITPPSTNPSTGQSAAPSNTIL